MVELEDEPTAVVYSKALGGAPHGASAKSLTAATKAAQIQLALVEAAQQGLVSRLEAELGATVLHRVQRVYNGVAVLIDRDDLARIAEMPGVRSVYPLPPPVVNNAVSVPFIGAVEAWTNDPDRHRRRGDRSASSTPASTTFTATSAVQAARQTTPPTTRDNRRRHVSRTTRWSADGTSPAVSVRTERRSETPIPSLIPPRRRRHGSHVAGTAAGSGCR